MEHISEIIWNRTLPGSVFGVCYVPFELILHELFTSLIIYCNLSYNINSQCGIKIRMWQNKQEKVHRFLSNERSITYHH